MMMMLIRSRWIIVIKRTSRRVEEDTKQLDLLLMVNEIKLKDISRIEYSKVEKQERFSINLIS